MTPEKYRQFKAFSTEYGTFIGLAWILSFACYIGGLSTPMLGSLSLIVGLGSPIFAIYLLRRFRDKYNGGFISFGRSYWMAIWVFFYAALLTAMGQFVYFKFMDNGYLANAYGQIVNTPEMKNTLEQLFPNGQLQQVTDMLYSISPIQITFDLLSVNLILGVVLAMPVAILTMRRDYGESNDVPQVD